MLQMYWADSQVLLMLTAPPCAPTVTFPCVLVHPQIYGMFLVKLATALSLIGGVRQHEAGVRGDIHLLMIGR
jgi:hypothetical protein